MIRQFQWQFSHLPCFEISFLTILEVLHLYPGLHPALGPLFLIIDQLLDIVDQMQDVDLDTNAKLLEWSKRKFQSKVNEKIATEIALS